MSQNPQKPKIKIEPKMESVIQVKLPMVRNFSTGGGHGPQDTLFETDDKIPTKKWQGYPPANLNVVGKPLPPMPEVAIPRFLGKAPYATRILLPNMLYAKLLLSPHPHARIKSIDTSKAEKLPGVGYILTYKNAPTTYPLSDELHFQGDIVAIVAAETEDLAEDAIDAIEVDYEVLRFASTVRDVMDPNAPDLRRGKGNLMQVDRNNLHYDPNSSWLAQYGDVEKGFAEADMVKEFSYYFAGASPVPIQPCGCVAKWDGDQLTVWGMSQGIYPMRNTIARALRIGEARVRFIDKYNGCTFGGARSGSEKFYPFIAHIAKMAGKPVKLMLPKDQELAHLEIKPENITKFKVGLKNDGRITALVHEVYLSAGDIEVVWGGGNSADATELYTFGIPHWKSVWFNYKTNAIPLGCTRSCGQQEAKWAWESLMDELAETVGMDPVQFRLMHIAKPGPANLTGLEGKELAIYDSFASVEVLQEGAKAIGWDKRNPVPGGASGRFKKGIGAAVSMHHNGQMGYHDGELYFEKLADGAGGGQQGGAQAGSPVGGANDDGRRRAVGGFNQFYGAEIELTADGYVTMKNALPDSGTNHDTALAAVVAEILGFTTRDRIRVVWGDTALAPSSGQWYAGRTITQQGGPLFSAADKLRKDLLYRASEALAVDIAKLQIRDGVISSKEDPRKRITFAALATANKGPIRQIGKGGGTRQGPGRMKGIGACFVEVEVDTWTGNWKLLRSAYSHDSGLVVNPLVAEADMHGSLVQSFQMTTDAIPWDREFPGTRHYSVGYLSFRIPTIMDVPENQTNIFIDSLEPRWFFGIKSFSETSIGSVPGAIGNAIYNACGVRIREHPITREKIIAGLRAKGGIA
jgi:xanthine dehydrogenase YagR molybdenum-binding subunit